MEKIKTLTFTAEEFLQSLGYGGKLYSLLNNKYVFRGHASEKWDLLPTALRKDAFKHSFFSDEHQTSSYTSEKAPDNEYLQITNEILVLRDFFEKCDKYGLSVPEVKRLRDSIFLTVPKDLILDYEEWIPADFYELVSLAQHYGVPTRLLDWTYDLLVALYFAISGVEHLDKEEHSDNIVIWALDSRLADFVYYPASLLRLIRPRYDGNENIIAQKGLFSFWSVMKGVKPGTTKFELSPTNREPLDKLIQEQFQEGDKPLMYCIKISNNNLELLYDYLKHHHVEAATIYPGYKGIIKSIMEHQSFMSVAHEKRKRNKNNFSIS